MCVIFNGNRADRMYAYTMAMDAEDMREVLIPMTTDRGLTVSYKANGMNIKSVSYEVTAPDTGKVIENAKIGSFRTDGEYMTASFSLSEPILMNREYPITFTMSTTGGETYYFYARLLQRADLVTNEYVQFVYDFYESCTNKGGAAEINTYLETDTTVTNNSFTTVNLQSTFDQVTWGSLSPQIYRKGMPTIREINGTTCTITNEYMISALDSRGENEYYHVYEYYRLRYYNDRMMVLNFNRCALEVFDGTYGAISADGIYLGVAQRNVTFAANSGSNIIAFIQDGALWEFNENSQKLSQVFSFHSLDEQADERWDHSQYDIKIIRVAEGGDIDFVVYGYMNRGEYEGCCGVSVCHYSSETSIVQESAFIPYPMSPEYLMRDMERLCYVSSGGTAFLYLNRNVYAVDTNDRSVREILTDIDPDCLTASADHTQIAWHQEMKPNASTGLTVMDLDTGATRTIHAGRGQFIKGIGFINDDFIYGLANEADISRLPSGRQIFAMKTLVIEDQEGHVLKTYEQDNIWVNDVTIKAGLVELSRVTLENGNYTPVNTDNIMNNRQVAKSDVSTSIANTNRKGAVVTLKLSDSVRNLDPLVVSFKVRSTDGKNICRAEVPTTDEYELYYVYGSGKLEAIVRDPGEAVLLADSLVGVVIDREGQYIYERGNRQTENDLYNEDIPEAFVTGDYDAESLQGKVDPSITVMDLSGCTLEMVLYQVSQGRAVATRLADGTAALIVGYDRYNTLLYNFADGSHFYMGMNDSTAAFEAGGNVFVSYVKPQATVRE